MHWLSENYKWLFDGIGGAAAITVIGYFMHRFLGSSDQGSAVLRSSSTGRMAVASHNVAASAFRPLRNQQNTTQLAWPEEKGEYIAASSETIPPFPDRLIGFRPVEENQDFWNKPFPPRGLIRLFEGNDWEGIPSFPHTMNGCAHGVFMIRWRSANPSLPVRSSVRHSSKSKGDEKVGAFGYMWGSNCEQPMFKIVETPYGHTLVDLFYELKFWQAAP